MQHKSSIIRVEHINKKILKDNTSTNNKPPITNNTKDEEMILNAKLHAAKILKIDNYFEEIRSKVQTQFLSTTPIFSVEEMVSMPAIDKMLSIKSKHNLSTTHSSQHSIDTKSRTLTNKCILTSKGQKLMKMLNFGHLYLEEDS